MEILAIALMLIGIYLLLILGSYSQSDPGWFKTGSGAEIRNFGGTFGAYFSDLVLQGFGHIAYLIPILFAYGAFKFHQLKAAGRVLDYPRVTIIIIGVVLTFIGGCVLESLHFAHLAADRPFTGGGFLGDGFRKDFVASFGQIGTSLLALVAFLSGITMFSRLSWFWLMDTIGEQACDMVEWLKNFRQEREDRAIGEVAKESREDSVAQMREKVAVAKPIRIEPKIATPTVVDSGRREREKQVSLFTADDKAEHILPPLDLLDEESIAGDLAPNVAASLFTMQYIQQVDSTNAVAAKLALPAAGKFSVVLAEAQSAGKGRRGRNWISPFAANIYLSLVWPLQRPLHEASVLSPYLAICITESLYALGLPGLGLKWPNDIYCNNKKLAGLLIECSGELSDACKMVVGLGVNVAMTKYQHVDIDQEWTDVLSNVPDWPLTRSELAAQLINSLVSGLHCFEKNPVEDLVQRWARWDVMENMTINIHADTHVRHGIARGIDVDGCLLLDTGDCVERISVGDVSLRRQE